MTFTSIEDLATDIKTKLDSEPPQATPSPQRNTPKKKIIALYAFNATGKTRLSNLLSWMSEDWEVLEDENWDAIWDENWDQIGIKSWTIKTLCYNAFLEDMFVWDNENYILRFDPSSWIMQIVKDQELEGKVVDNFKDIIGSNIEPSFNRTRWEVVFNIVSGGNDSVTNIKISRGEESMLIWSVFYTVLETAIDALNDAETVRTTQEFNDLQYIIIDDPVSSIDDTKIITIAIKLIDAIKKYQGTAVKFLITTHHALFHSVLVNDFNRLKRNHKCNFESHTLYKENWQLYLKHQNDSPFSYHLSIKKIIQEAIDTNNIEKYHYNLFRNLLEKTAIFLGYNDWSDCIIEEKNKEELKQRLQIYSHSKWSDLESVEIWEEDKKLLQETFASFVANFNWKV